MRLTVIAAVAACSLLSACSTPAPDPQPQPSASASAERPTSSVPSPDAGQRADYLAALEKIDPGLVVNEERVLRRAGRICERILHGSDGAMSLEEYTVEELSGGNATIDEAQAKQVIKAVKAWCKP